MISIKFTFKLLRVKFAVNIDSCSIYKKNKLILQTFLRKYNKNNTFIFANLGPKLSRRGEKIKNRQ